MIFYLSLSHERTVTGFPHTTHHDKRVLSHVERKVSLVHPLLFFSLSTLEAVGRAVYLEL